MRDTYGPDRFVALLDRVVAGIGAGAVDTLIAPATETAWRPSHLLRRGMYYARKAMVVLGDRLGDLRHPRPAEAAGDDVPGRA